MMRLKFTCYGFAGRVLEYDTPTKLLEREGSAFSKLIKEYSMRSKGM
jgi:hypothetical protein